MAAWSKIPGGVASTTCTSRGSPLVLTVNSSVTLPVMRWVSALGIGLHGLLPRTRQLALQGARFGRLHAEAACLVEPAFLLGAVPGDCRIARLLEIRGAQIVHGALCAGARRRA